MFRTLFLFVFILVSAAVVAQPTFPVNGVANQKPIYTAFTNANIFTDYQTLLTNATLLVKDDKIEAIGTNITLPKGTIIYNLKGKYIYPAFIDLCSSYGMPEVKRGEYTGNQFLSNSKTSTNWNQAVKPEIDAISLFGVNSKEASELRKVGFGAVLTQQADGIMRGTSAMVALGDGKVNEQIVKDKAATGYSFSKGVSTQDYPSSLMGSIALMRQSFYDADWYAKGGNKVEFNLSLDAINLNKKLPAVFEVGDKLNVVRADKVGDEFGIQFIIKGGGDEYQRIDEIKATGAPVIVPVNFPMAFDISDPDAAALIQLTDMKHWELAPTNAAAIDKAGIPFTFTSAGLKEPAGFLRNVRKTVEYGLPYKAAIKALTQTPANLAGVTNLLGDLKQGKLASFLITNDSLFTRTTAIAETWVNGKRYSQEDITMPALRGSYNATIKPENGAAIPFAVVMRGTPGKPSAEIKRDSLHFDIEVRRDNNMLTFTGNLKRLGLDANFTSNVYIINTDADNHAATLSGRGVLSNGSTLTFDAAFVNDTIKTKRDTFKLKTVDGKAWLPFAPYGSTEKAKPATYHIKNATVWTNESQGKLENADVVITNGKITAVGKSLATPSGATVIDGTGKHVTPGIIDEHSHIAISKGVNEGAQSVSSEVRIGDVVNPDDVNIYRQLSGGVTAAQLLHGSANCIGGQSAIIKLRWGQPAEDMKIKSAPGFIKFALGENVKQSNWGDDRTVRFPQTRMGVEQTFKDAFTRAKEYNKLWAVYNATKTTKNVTAPPRKDLELDALVEILDKKRFITCHSYVQSEINMLMKLGDSLGFKVNTFTHILEGYKLADKMASRGIAGSTFSDWWSYKYEVMDASPYNAALMTKAGVLTSINSDDAEMARRLNQEAGKTVKYGKLGEEDALKLVTLNPAKMLHIDDVCGSLKPGKDADVVIWSDNPLSIYARAQKPLLMAFCCMI
ncbi:MAG: amidohydrolase family protein [Sphingobacteriales bacterium JAD_PAG50586_3]|nr:MAG: amidohydrolase family protein [Sphingobacteriales bacterium JAD_PAG50586_3]